MKRIIIFFVSLLVVGFAASGCHFAPSHELGDTVAASEFEPVDTALLNKKAAKTAAKSLAIADSVGIYYIGSGSTKEFIQLVSYPSKRDTLVYGKTRHVRVKGSADYNNVVRVKWYLLNGKDSLVKEVEQIEVK